MKLLLDCGNSRLKWALADPARGLWRQGAVETVEALPPLLEVDPEEIVVASVRQDSDFQAQLTWLRHWQPGGVRVLATPMAHGGLQCAYAEPQRLGVDRWLAMQGAWARLESGFTVVDAGTAVTIDLVADDGRHQGGAILPGVAFMVESLVQGTTGIRPRPDDGPARYPARDTGAAVRAGSQMAVEGAVRQALHEATMLDCHGPLLLTGGDAAVLAEMLRDLSPWHLESLVFEGMLEMSPC
ncbi:type III pantothenate kinase [Natronospira proteinivora]|uniref:Type III pantothenate kinase n=1 Tax=Natronospira proteinivora TaxID=1807133 RepID=A0ABT1GC47_9GAMM|nr:type III pantothenate kinase [Natronospira proteinivora]MCP1728500.1 type III pantothenate kinase [Natronospira proteinivora]